jgi:peptide/nickel transport system ATP-binding protein
VAESAALLEITNLRTYFRSGHGPVRAVDGISLALHAGQTLGIVGESGSGKSVTALSVLQLLPEMTATIESGSVVFLGRDLLRLPTRDLRDVRGRMISMIFQEPGTSLNPVFTIGNQIGEAIQLGGERSSRVIRDRTAELLREVGIRDVERVMASYPHQISGGQKQRAMIAMALSCDPKLLIADEPTTALDVTVQKQILDLLRELRDRRGMAILFISHDLGVISEIADHVAVMYRGKVVETGSVLEIFRSPRHPYTKGLLACRARLGGAARRLMTVADFMEVKEVDGEITIVERPTPPADTSRGDGRGRRFHPKSELQAMGIDPGSVVRSDDDVFLPEEAEPMLEVADLVVHFPIRKGVFRRRVGEIKAVDGVSFRVYPGQTLGLVGESGCGKTTTGRAILRLIPITSGKILFQGRDLSTLARGELCRVRRRLQVVFQDPYGSLNPRLSVESTLTGPMRSHGLGRDARDRRDRAAQLLVEVGLGPEHLSRYPHEFSGGQRQRICIARALSVEPDLLICDESVSALDVSVQAQILNLLKDLQTRRNLTYIFISHDLGVVKFMADMMAVMNQGRIVEIGPSEAVYRSPRELYTRRLIEAIPDDSLTAIERRLADRRSAGD